MFGDNLPGFRVGQNLLKGTLVQITITGTANLASQWNLLKRVDPLRLLVLPPLLDAHAHG